MTRITNFGRKRKYVEAGFAIDPSLPSNDNAPFEVKTGDDRAHDPHENSARPKKKRRGAKRVKKTGDGVQKLAQSEAGGETAGDDKEEGPSSGQKKSRFAKKDWIPRNIAVSGYKKRTEQRRLQRIADRTADTICFACRERGHAARDCPKAAGEGESGEDRKNVKSSVGMCYRCGSGKHTLSRCKNPEDPHNPLPFASCFVCSGRGHLASSCPQNQEKGIYPNGGSCKLCGEKTHLAKDCELRKKDKSGTAGATMFGTGKNAGADEDDFHTFKRKNAEVSKQEKKAEQQRKQLEVKTGLYTGTVKAFGEGHTSNKPKKVVVF